MAKERLFGSILFCKHNWSNNSVEVSYLNTCPVNCDIAIWIQFFYQMQPIFPCFIVCLRNTAPFSKKEVSAKKDFEIVDLLRWKVLYGHLLLLALVRGFIL